MKLFVILSFFLGISMISSPVDGSFMINQIQLGTITDLQYCCVNESLTANAFYHAQTFDPSHWFQKCCGKTLNASKLQQIKSYPKTPVTGALVSIFHLVEITFENFKFEYMNGVYGENHLDCGMEEMNRYADALNELYNKSGTPTSTKKLIEQMAIDMFTNICWMKATQGPGRDIVYNRLN
ncbi:uncharacterized protein LOC116342079 [Contarinia nasturtii]|uniref:uncharacterized protein LOC116342079 n=1 Tax=Contarinia nasturtii TaxID=265458 RepID=UPI0012D43F78|nr:uncharacterized protein LOC116342079 [Contarinia nasturtii]